MGDNLPSKWADKAMFEAAPIEGGPKVFLLWMTPDPLGAIAAACRMYEGKPTYDLHSIDNAERAHYWEQAKKTHLKAPLEFVNFHFFIEGVDRSFTHQMVRQRTAVFAQESMRFAVKERLADETPLPPSLAGLPEEDPLVHTWRNTVEIVEWTYRYLVNSGIPAEEARGMLPHATTTRLHYHTNLRNLLEHAGNRLCTQAQFHWRIVFAQIAKAISEYTLVYRNTVVSDPDRWQFEELSKIFRPVCYELNRCPFQASFDRACSIRDRVEAFAEHGVSSDLWGRGSEVDQGEWIEPIRPEEWLLDPSAARER